LAWRYYVLYSVITAISIYQVIYGVINLNVSRELISIPSNEGIVTSLLFGVAILVIYPYRMKRQEA